ncbi:MAG: hypothetical protein AAB619_04080 [Patescibacteria group bacterium]
MTRARLIIVVTILFWLVAGGSVLRINRLWFGPVTFRWPNPSQPNAAWRWAVPSADNNAIIPANTNSAFKVTVPRKFSSGELSVATVPGQGVLTVSINAPAGKTGTAGTTPTGGVVTLPLAWDAIAWQERTFIVKVTSDVRPVEIKTITMELSR